MELRDLIVTPLLLIVVYALAYVVRPYVSTLATRRYFFPAMTARIFGAIAAGMIYQFYYGGGDTFAYHTHGSRVIWEALIDDVGNGLKIFFSDGTNRESIYEYSTRIWYFRDQQSFFVIRVATLFDLFTFSTYSATAVLFAIISFIGAWMLFTGFVDRYFVMRRWIAFGVLFIPSAVFWGSGIFKDSLTLTAVSIAIAVFYSSFILKRFALMKLLTMIVAFWVIYSIKKYILLCLLPALLIWWFAYHIAYVRSTLLRWVLVPIATIIALSLGYLAINQVTYDDPKYSLSMLAETAKITAYDIRYGWGARYGEGSGYDLGELDGTWTNMIKLAPAAINVSLFRPYLWEVRNPLMLFSAIESIVLLIMTLWTIVKLKGRFFQYLTKPDVLFCFVFSLIFSFAVGISTYNFGTLSRYKIPMLPFYALGLILMHYYWKRDKKLGVFDVTE